MSMGWAAGRKLRRAIDGLARVLAIELLASTRAIDLRLAAGAGEPAPATRAVHALFRTRIAAPGPDAFLSPDLTSAHAFVTGGDVLAAAADALGTALD